LGGVVLFHDEVVLQFSQETDQWGLSGQRRVAHLLVIRSSSRSGNRQRSHREAEKLSKFAAASCRFVIYRSQLSPLLQGYSAYPCPTSSGVALLLIIHLSSLRTYFSLLSWKSPAK